jgi:hypothetical protein
VKVHDTLEEEWESYFREVLEGQGIDPQSAPGLRLIFFAGAGSLLALGGRGVPLIKLRDEILAFHASLPGRPN